MSIHFLCKSCQRPIAAPDDLAGQSWHCPEKGCRRTIQVPRWGLGQVIARRWRVRKIFEGGMGRVYIAQDIEALREGTFLQMAFKTFKDALNLSHTRSFLQEARHWIEAGHHPHLVTALQASELEGWPLLEMEYVHGSTLKAWIARQRLSLAQAINFGIQLCRGMDYVSRDAGLVHRDLKPSNLLIDDLNVLKVTDLGISRPIAARGEEPEHAAGSPGIAGTAAYMSPEQFGSVAIDTLSDIYSTGVILYEMSTGLQPFRASRFEELRHLHREAEAVPPRRWNPIVPAALERIILRCLSKKPQERFPGFAELLTALQEVYEAFPLKKPFAPPRQREFPQEQDLLARCYSMLTLQQFESARQLGEELIRLNPGNAEAWNNTGVALVELHRLEEAERYLQRAIELNPEYVEALANLGGVLARRGRLEEAQKLLKRALSINPDYAEALANLGMCLAKMGNERAAWSSFDHAAAVDPSYWKVWAIRGDICLQLNRPEEARECCRKIEKHLPNQPMLWELQAWVALALGQPEEALSASKQGLDRRPDSTGLWTAKLLALDALHEEDLLLREAEEATRRFPKHIAFHLIRGSWHSRHGEKAQAAESFARAAELEPENELAWQGRGEVLLELGRVEEAAACYRKSVELLPEKASAWQGLGVALLRLDRPREALAALKRAVRLAPQDPAAQDALAACRRSLKTAGPVGERTPFAKGLDLLHGGSPRDALKELTSAIEQDPQNAVAYRTRGICHLKLEQLQAAEADLSRAVELNPCDSFSRSLRAKALFDLGQVAEAQAQAREAVSLKDADFFSYQVLGDIAHSQRDYEEGAKAFANAIENLRERRSHDDSRKELTGLLAHLHCSYGICLKQLGRFQSALEQLQNAARLNPADPRTRDELRDFE